MTEKIIYHGGATHSNSIGQKCDTIYRRVGGKMKRIMIDCGTEFQRDGETGAAGTGPDFSSLGGEKVDALVLTHSHTDHIGAVPTLFRQNLFAEEAKIIASPQTHEVKPFVYEDGLKHDNGYDALDAIEVIDEKRKLVVKTPGEIEILPGLPGFIPQVGHIPGAMGIILPTSSGINGLIMGDTCWHDQPITKGALLPSKVFPKRWTPDEIWSTDLTYGYGQKKKIADEVTRFKEAIKANWSEGKKTVVAAFANGRTQNLAVWCREAGAPCFIDGMGRKIYRVFRETHWTERDGLLPEIGDGIFLVESAEHREELLRRQDPLVIITTGGMGDFGPIVRYMEYGMPRKDWSFFFSSYLAPSTTGEKLMKLEWWRQKDPKGNHQVKLLKQNDERIRVPLVASIDHFRMSAHGDLDDFIRFVEDIVHTCRGGTPLRRIILTHGTPETKILAAQRLRNLSQEIIWGERNTALLLS